MKFILSIAMAVLILSAASTPAIARPSLSIHEANIAAEREADSTVSVWLEFYDPENEDPDDPSSRVFIVSYDIDPCEVTSLRAECDLTYTLNDGDQCDSTITVQKTRRGRIRSNESDIVCDSDQL